MFYVLIRHKIANYAAWKRAVRKFATFRRASGERSFQALRSNKSPNAVTVLCGWTSAASARRFIQSPELRNRMREAGVVSKPEIQFFRTGEDLSVS